MTRRQWITIIVTAGGLAVIGLLQSVPNRQAIEENLTQRSSTALQTAGISGVEVRFEGRDGILRVPSKSDLDRAVLVVEGVEGVRVVSASAPEPEPAKPAPKNFRVTVDGLKVAVTGATSAEEAGLGSVVKALGPTASGVVIELADGKITLTGKVESAAISEAAAGAAAQVVSAANVTNRLELLAKPEVVQRELTGLPQITFENDSATLTPQGQVAVAQAAAILRGNPSAKVRIEGHTDSNGTPESNLVLSRNRALTVLNALVAMGIDASRLTSEGFGESRPRVPDNSAANRAINRRVEFIVQ